MNMHTSITTAQLLNQVEPKKQKALQDRSHVLRQCEYTDHMAEPVSGIEYRGRWVCGKCWPLFARRGFK